MKRDFYGNLSNLSPIIFKFWIKPRALNGRIYYVIRVVEKMARICVFAFLVFWLTAGYLAKHHKTKMANKAVRPSSTRNYKWDSLRQADIQTELKPRKPENSTSHLRSALDVLAPEADVKNTQEYRLPLLSKPIPAKFHSEAPRSSALSNSNDTQSDVVFEVIDMDPYSGAKTRFNKRFFILTALYVASGLVSIIATCCIAKFIIKRKKRHSQYMLLTKSDMEYHRGGGGI